MSGTVRTVLGQISATDVGRCLPHEHLLCDFSKVTGNPDHLLNDIDLAVDELAHFTAAGGRTIVEITPPDLGRDPIGLRTIAQRSGVNIIMATGWYRRAFYPDDLERTATDQLAEAMVNDLTEGVNDTGIRAGIIGEIGVDRDFVSGIEERVLRAAARAHLRTGATVSTHSSMYAVGIAQLDILTDEGVAPENVIIGHADTYLDSDYHHVLLTRGASLQFDTAGRNHMNPDLRRVKAFVNLAREGFLDNLLLSSDRCFRSDLAAFGGVGYAHVLTTFRDLLYQAGLASEEFDVVTIDNPSRLLGW